MAGQGEVNVRQLGERLQQQRRHRCRHGQQQRCEEKVKKLVAQYANRVPERHAVHCVEVRLINNDELECLSVAAAVEGRSEGG